MQRNSSISFCKARIVLATKPDKCSTMKSKLQTSVPDQLRIKNPNKVAATKIHRQIKNITHQDQRAFIPDTQE